MGHLMTRTDYKVIFTALGFLAVILDDVPRDRQALRATTLAQLIEAFCASAMPDAFSNAASDGVQVVEAEQHLERYLADLRETGSADLSHDRQTLLRMYDLLLIEKTRFEQTAFLESGHDDVIANRVLQLADDRLRREQNS
jgi:hypothetical protein